MNRRLVLDGLVTPLADGSMVELAMVGSEGLVGGFAALNGDIAPETALAMVGTDYGHRMTIGDFRREMDRRRPFHDVVNQCRRHQRRCEEPVGCAP